MVPNDETEEEDPKFTKKLIKLLTKPLTKLKKDKMAMKTIKKAVVQGRLSNANRTALWRKILSESAGDSAKTVEEYKVSPFHLVDLRPLSPSQLKGPELIPS